MVPRQLWFRFSVTVGVLLSLLLLIESLTTYRYVEGGLIREEAQREAARHTRSLARAARLMIGKRSSDLGPIVREMAHENAGQVAWIRILAADGHVVAASDHADQALAYKRTELPSMYGLQQAREWKTASGPVLAIATPFSIRDRLSAPLTGRLPQPEFIEVAMYLKGIAVNFGPLRQNLIAGLAASLALLGAVIIIGLRFGDYVHGKQVENELAMARKVQLDLFPAESDLPTQIQFAARYVSAREVGGDLYDVFDTEDGETALVLADVSGKGVSAALLMGVVQGAVRASFTRGAPVNCADTFERLNRLLCLKTARERFVTMFWCHLNTNTGMLRYVNAGQCPPLLIRGGAPVMRLEQGGPVLGLLPRVHYDEAQVVVEPDDLLAIYSDGIVEAADPQDEEFGEERLISVIERNRNRPAGEICRAILEEVKSFTGGGLLQDDQTIVITRLTPEWIKKTTQPRLSADLFDGLPSVQRSY